MACSNFWLVLWVISKGIFWSSSTVPPYSQHTRFSSALPELKWAYLSSKPLKCAAKGLLQDQCWNSLGPSCIESATIQEHFCIPETVSKPWLTHPLSHVINGYTCIIWHLGPCTPSSLLWSYSSQSTLHKVYAKAGTDSPQLVSSSPLSQSLSPSHFQETGMHNVEPVPQLNSFIRQLLVTERKEQQVRQDFNMLV